MEQVGNKVYIGCSGAMKQLGLNVRLRAIRILLSFLVFSLTACHQGHAAIIETTITPEMAEMGCTVRISGLIEEGDSERLGQFLSAPPSYDDYGDRFNFSPGYRFGFPFATHRLCLNSVGGSFMEAIEIAESLDQYFDEYSNPGVPTAVASGDTCLSACALIFMGGRYAWNPYSDSYWEYDRILHPNGLLGFHAPLLLLEERAYSYDEARSIQEINALSVSRLMNAIGRGAMNINAALLSDMFQRNGSDLLVIERLGQATLYNIAVAPYDVDAANNQTVEELLVNQCDHAARYLGGYVLLYRDDRVEWALSIAEGQSRFSISADSNYVFLAGNVADPRSEISVAENSNYGFSCSQSAGTLPNAELQGFDEDLFLRALVRDTMPRSSQSMAETFMPGAGGEGNSVQFTSGQWGTPLQGLALFFSHREMPVDMLLSELAELGTPYEGPIGARYQGLPRSCFPQAETLQIARVNEFATLRSRPGFEEQILAEVPLDAIVIVRGGIATRGSAERVEACNRACGREADGRGFPAEVRSCYFDSIFWLPVEYDSQRGWISGRYLSEG